MDSFNKELDDILPTYNKYIHIKRDYQLGKASETAVIDALELVCAEIYDLVSTIYSGTDMYKERRTLKKLLNSLETQYLS